MIELTEHAKTILRAIADGKRFQLRRKGSVWEDAEFNLGSLAAYLTNYEENVRIAPETRSINGVVFAAPTDEDTPSKYILQIGSDVYVWATIKDRDNAKQAIIDALEGRTK